MLSATRCSRPFTSAARGARQVPSVATCAYIEASTGFAVFQQSIAFAAVAGAEAVFTRSQTSSDTPGRPDIFPLVPGVAAVVVGGAIANSGNDFLVTPGLIVGFLASGAVLAYMAKRFTETPAGDGSDWPGPKAWPASMALFSFFILCAFLQALKAEL